MIRSTLAAIAVASIAALSLAACGASTPSIPAASFTAATRDFNDFVAASQNLNAFTTAAGRASLAAPLLRISANANELAAFHQTLETALGKPFSVTAYGTGGVQLLAATSTSTWGEAWQYLKDFTESVSGSILGELTVGSDMLGVAQPVFMRTGLETYVRGTAQDHCLTRVDACESGIDPMYNAVRLAEKTGDWGAALAITCPNCDLVKPTPTPTAVPSDIHNGTYKGTLTITYVCAKDTGVGSVIPLSFTVTGDKLAVSGGGGSIGASGALYMTFATSGAHITASGAVYPSGAADGRWTGVNSAGCSGGGTWEAHLG
jgi:hypothetical protein